MSYLQRSWYNCLHCCTALVGGYGVSLSWERSGIETVQGTDVPPHAGIFLKLDLVRRPFNCSGPGEEVSLVQYGRTGSVENSGLLLLTGCVRPLPSPATSCMLAASDTYSYAVVWDDPER